MTSDGSPLLDADVEMPQQPAPSDPLYIVQARVTLTDERVHYFVPVDSIDGTDHIDISEGLEEAGSARLYAEPGVGVFMLGTGETGSITHIEIDDDGRFSKGASISFAGLGVSSLGFRTVTFVDASRALYRDDSQLQVIEWNPSDMTITRAIDLPGELLRPELTAISGSEAVRRGDQVLFPLMWFAPGVERVPAEVALVSVDLATGEASAVSDPRCPVGGVTFTAPDGATYFFNQLTSTYADRVLGSGRAGCALRIRAGETTFDPDYLLELGSLVDGAAAAAIGWGGGSRVWFRALDESLFAPLPGTSYGEFFAANAWRLWRTDVTRPELGAVRDDSTPVASCCGQSYVVDGVPYGQQISGDTATLVDLSGDTPVPKISVPQFIAEVVRLR